MGWVSTSYLTGIVPELETTDQGQTQSESYGKGRGRTCQYSVYPAPAYIFLSSLKQSYETGPGTCKLVRARI